MKQQKLRENDPGSFVNVLAILKRLEDGKLSDGVAVRAALVAVSGCLHDVKT